MLLYTAHLFSHLGLVTSLGIYIQMYAIQLTAVSHQQRFHWYPVSPL